MSRFTKGKTYSYNGIAVVFVHETINDYVFTVPPETKYLRLTHTQSLNVTELK